MSTPNFVRAQAFAESRAGSFVAVLCAAALVPIFAIDLLTPADVTVSILVVFPVLAAAWLVPTRPLVAVAGAAIALQLVLGASSELNWVTVLANTAALVAISAVGHVASVNSHEVRASREHQLGLLLEAARTLSSSTELQTVLDNVVEATASFIADGQHPRRLRATIWRVDADRVHAVCEFDATGFSMLGPRVAISDQLQRILKGDAVTVLRAEQLAPEMRDLYSRARVDRLAVAPVHVEGELFGALTAGSRDERVFSSGDLRLLEGIADLASLAIANAQKLESERLRTRVFETLHGVATELARSANPSDLTRLVVERARELANADSAVLGLKEDSSPILRVVADSPETAAFILRADRQPIREALKSKQPVVINDIDEATPEAPAIAADARSVAVLPVVSGNRSLGVLVVASRSETFSDEQVQAILMLAAQIGSGLEDLRLRRDLLESDRRFRSLYAALGCGVVVHDAKGSVVDVNWAAGNLLGMSPEALRAQPPFGPGWRVLLEDGTELPNALRPPASVANYGRPIRNLNAYVVRPDGKRVLLRIDSSGIEEQGKLQWIVTSFFELSVDRAETKPRSARSRPRR